jgi:phospholipid transport system substrate-binding protein
MKSLSMCLLLLSMLLVSWSVQASHAAQQVIMQTADQVLVTLRDHRSQMASDQQRVLQLINERIMPHVDVHYMSRWALGKYWRRAQPQQQQRFMQEFKQLLMRTYATALLEFADYDISYAPIRAQQDASDVTVHSKLQHTGGQPISVSYRMHVTGGHWKAYDISIEGVSLIASYRNSFASELRRGNLERLISQLNSKNQAAFQGHK